MIFVCLTWQFSCRDVLSVLVGQLLECSQAAAEAQDGICGDTTIWQTQEAQVITTFSFYWDSVDLTHSTDNVAKLFEMGLLNASTIE